MREAYLVYIYMHIQAAARRHLMATIHDFKFLLCRYKTRHICASFRVSSRIYL